MPTLVIDENELELSVNFLEIKADPQVPASRSRMRLKKSSENLTLSLIVTVSCLFLGKPFVKQTQSPDTLNSPQSSNSRDNIKMPAKNLKTREF